MSENKISTTNIPQNYDHYTSQGADLHQAHTEYAEYSEANHQSFFNMNNAAGLFKVIIIGAIVLIVIHVMSPLFSLFKAGVGLAGAAAGFATDLLKACENIGHCIPNGTVGPGETTHGTCDGNGPIKKGTACTITEPDKDDDGTDKDCGSSASKTCIAGILIWLILGPLTAILGALIAAWAKRGKKGKIDDAKDKAELDGVPKDKLDKLDEDIKEPIAEDEEDEFQDGENGELNDGGFSELWENNILGKTTDSKPFPKKLSKEPPADLGGYYNKMPTDPPTWELKSNEMGGDNNVYDSRTGRPVTGQEAPSVPDQFKCSELRREVINKTSGFYDQIDENGKPAAGAERTPETSYTNSAYEKFKVNKRSASKLERAKEIRENSPAAKDINNEIAKTETGADAAKAQAANDAIVDAIADARAAAEEAETYTTDETADAADSDANELPEAEG